MSDKIKEILNKWLGCVPEDILRNIEKRTKREI